MTEEISEYKISQLRRMRAFQREELSQKLYPEYSDAKIAVLSEVNNEMDELLKKSVILDRKRGRILRGTTEEEFQIIKTEINRCESKRKAITEKFEATADRNIKLRTFDIETEQIILGAVCGLESICSKKVLPLIEGEV